MSFWSRLATPRYRNTGSTARDHLASERTFLAWTRTGLGFVALGMAVERFAQLDIHLLLGRGGAAGATSRPRTEEDRRDEARDRQNSRVVVGVLMAVGTGSAVYATARYFSVLRALERGEFRPAYKGVTAVGVVVAALTGGVFAGTARGWGRDGDGEREDVR